MVKEYTQLEITDNFMFCKVMNSNPDLCRHMLEIILNQKIREIRIDDSEKSISIIPDSKSIRMDVYLDDADGTVYDLEMQTTSHRDLPQRARYYNDVLDLNHLEKGQQYERLPKTVIIFICTFDFWKAGHPVYTFENTCIQDSNIILNDGSRKVFVNLTGNPEEMTSDLRALSQYMNHQTIEDDFTRTLDLAVVKAKHNKTWEVEFMQNRAYEMRWECDLERAREQAIAEGRAEGRAKGLAEGLAEGRAEGRTEGRAEGRAEGTDMLFHAICGLRKGESEKQLLDKGIPKDIIDKALQLL